MPKRKLIHPFRNRFTLRYRFPNPIFLIIITVLIPFWIPDSASLQNLIMAKAYSHIHYNNPAKSANNHPALYTKSAALDPGEVILYWTAPGDDDMYGRAAGYDLRYQPDEDGPINNDQEWEDAIQVSNEPLPSFPGQTDSLVIGGLDYGAGYYFCIRAFDNVGNYSARSNSPLIISGDTVGNDYVLGDVNDNGIFNGLDIIYLVGYFKGRNPPPVHIMAADGNGDCYINGLDVIYMVDYFKGGQPLRRGDCKRTAFGNP
jgi:hypothetical protein